MTASAHPEPPAQPGTTGPTSPSTPAASDPETMSADARRYDSFYRGDSPLRDAAGHALVPWDVGTPQPELIGLEESGQITGSVLDAGCGTADNAFFLHGRGHRVTGFDASPTAVAQAQARARAQGADITFTVADATEPTGLTEQFDTVLDSALYHCIDSSRRQSYIDSLHRLCRPGGRLHLMCFSDTAQHPSAAVAYISEAELRDVLSDGWRITTLRRARYLTAFTHRHVELSAHSLGYGSPASYLRSEFDGSNEQGLLYAHAWLVSADRL